MLKDLHIRKGDIITVTLAGMFSMEKIFPDANTFKIDRFSKENEKNIPRYQYIPFYIGKRVCLGRHLGELMVKLLVSQFCRNYEFKRPEGVEYYILNMLLNGIENPEVEVRLKRAL